MLKCPRKVYLITNIVNGKMYVGSSNNPNRRYRYHISLLKSGKHPVEDMQNDFLKYGNCFNLSIIDSINSYEERNKEYEWMQKLKTVDRKSGYNYKDGHWRTIKHLFIYQGEQRTVAELSAITGISKTVLYNRLLAFNWDVEKAATTPVHEHTEYYKRWLKKA